MQRCGLQNALKALTAGTWLILHIVSFILSRSSILLYMTPLRSVRWKYSSARRRAAGECVILCATSPQWGGFTHHEEDMKGFYGGGPLSSRVGCVGYQSRGRLWSGAVSTMSWQRSGPPLPLERTDSASGAAEIVRTAADPLSLRGSTTPLLSYQWTGGGGGRNWPD